MRVLSLFDGISCVGGEGWRLFMEYQRNRLKIRQGEDNPHCRNHYAGKG